MKPASLHAPTAPSRRPSPFLPLSTTTTLVATLLLTLLLTLSHPSPIARADDSPTNAPVTPAPAPAPAPSDFEAFRLIAERNIFSPARSGPRPSRPQREPEKPRVVDSLSLVGTMSYPKGIYAFFSGSSSDFRKVLTQGDSIAGFTLQEITPDSVKLEADSKSFVLKINHQLRRENEGEWSLSDDKQEYARPSGSSSRDGSRFGSRRDRGDRSRSEDRPASNGGSSTSTPAADSAEVSDILKRLMEQREKELK